MIFSIFGCPVFSQTTESASLLHQAFESVETNPEEAFKIAQHIIRSSEKEKQKAEAYLLSAEANYIQGNYDQALIDAFEARKFYSEKETFEKSTLLVAETLQFLQLNGEADKYLKEINAEKINSKRPAKLEFYLSRADRFFQEKKNDSSVLMLQNALQLAKQIKNPFHLLEIHQKLAANYLSLDDKKLYHAHNQETLTLRTVTTRIENNASNTAHQLINQTQDEELLKINYQYSRLLWILVAIIFLLILIKLTLTARNNNKLKTYQTVLNYLNQEKFNKKEVQTEMISEETPDENLRQSTILKESENQILRGLKKFESSRRFTHKDMSLSMLASQLNTNTKYLSEVINRHKKKNFNSYINELRINYITDKIKSEPSYLNYKVSYLAEACGFSSHSTFTTVFKSVVGVSPITFIEFVKKGNFERKGNSRMKQPLNLYLVWIILLIFVQDSVAQKVTDSAYNAATLNVYDNPDKAIEIGMHMFETSQEHPKRQVNALLLLSNAYSSKREYEKSLDYALKARNLSKNSGNLRSEISVLNKIAAQYHQLGIYDKALQYLDESEQIISSYAHKDSIQMILGNNYGVRGFIYRDQLSCDVAIDYFNRSLRQFKLDAENPKMIANMSVITYNKGNCFITIGQIDSAQINFKQSLSFALKAKANSLEAFSRKGLAEVHTLGGSYDLAIAELKKAVEVSEDVGDLVLNQGLYKGLADNYLAINNWDEYRKYNQKYLATEVQNKNEERKTISTSLAKHSHEVAVKIKTIKFKFGIGISIAVVVVLILIILIISRQIKFQKKFKSIQSKLKFTSEK